MNGRGAAPGAALFLPAAVKKAERRRAARPRAGGLPYLNGLPCPRTQPRPGELCPAPARGNGAPAHAGEKADGGFPLSAGAGASKGSQGTAFPKFHRVFNIPVENGAWFSPIQHSSAAQMHIKLSVSAYFGFKW